ncbi:MAG: colanic acid biosynthesis acetyltransferase WcaF [Zetaproteobacteria bacterium]|nr:colanic acid biosynthesis acetyltransferase WcaF [Zetaproteobacteria bacterium]
MPKDYQKLEQFQLPDGFRGRSALVVQLWWLVQSTLFAMSPQFMYSWRVMLLRLFGAKVGEGVIIRPSVRMTYPWKVKIGNHVWIGDHAELYSLGEIEIGDDVVISQKSYLCAATHDYSKPSFDMMDKKITIEDQAWLATDVFIAPGVTIGRGALIGARSSVFSDMPEGMICVGSPAKITRKR